MVYNMKIEVTGKLEKKIKDEKTIRRSYPQIANKILFALSALSVADCLEEVPICRPLRRHKLSGYPKGQEVWAIDISANYRLVFEAVDNSDPKDIVSIRLLEIVDYH